jgi:hypothetical protein
MGLEVRPGATVTHLEGSVFGYHQIRFISAIKVWAEHHLEVTAVCGRERDVGLAAIHDAVGTTRGGSDLSVARRNPFVATAVKIPALSPKASAAWDTPVDLVGGAVKAPPRSARSLPKNAIGRYGTAGVTAVKVAFDDEWIHQAVGGRRRGWSAPLHLPVV